MDEFGRAREAYERRHGVQPILTLPKQEPQEKPAPEIQTPKPYTLLSIDMTNGQDVFRFQFDGTDLLENLMHSDRNEGVIRERLLSMLRGHLSSGIK